MDIREKIGLAIEKYQGFDFRGLESHLDLLLEKCGMYSDDSTLTTDDIVCNGLVDPFYRRQASVLGVAYDLLELGFLEELSGITMDSLARKYGSWLEYNNLPSLSADELLVEDFTNSEQKFWLNSFIVLWEIVEERENKR